MAIRKVIQIDEEKCNGCGKCVNACAEGAIAMIDGKAKLVSDVYCDGLGACIGDCPVDAISFVEREAAEYDQAAVDRHLVTLGRAPHGGTPAPAPAPAAGHGHGHGHGGGCPGAMMRSMARPAPAASPTGDAGASQLSHWPVQLMLVPPHAPWLAGADLLLTADCVPFAYANYHRDFLAGRVTLIGCPKLDDVEYYEEKLRQIFQVARPKSVTVLRMEVPCCGGLAHITERAAKAVAPAMPVAVKIIGIDGSLK